MYRKKNTVVLDIITITVKMIARGIEFDLGATKRAVHRFRDRSKPLWIFRVTRAHAYRQPAVAGWASAVREDQYDFTKKKKKQKEKLPIKYIPR